MSRNSDPYYFSREGADKLCNTIERYWKGRGYKGINAQRFLIPGCPGHYGVRSNIGPDGFPPADVQ